MKLTVSCDAGWIELCLFRQTSEVPARLRPLSPTSSSWWVRGRGLPPAHTVSSCGRRPQVVDRELFDAVLARLEENHRRPRAKGEPRRPHAGAPLTGLIYDSAGHRMSPVNCPRKNGATYRYFVSTAVQSGTSDEAGVCPRVSAPIVESVVVEQLQTLGLCRLIDHAPDWPTQVLSGREHLPLGQGRRALSLMCLFVGEVTMAICATLKGRFLTAPREGSFQTWAG